MSQLLFQNGSPCSNLEEKKQSRNRACILESTSEVEQPCDKTQRGLLSVESISGTQHDSREQLSTESIPQIPPLMPSMSQKLVHQIRHSGHCKSSFESSNSICIVEPLSLTSSQEDFDESSIHMTGVALGTLSFVSSQEDFDESSVHMTGVTSSTPVYEGGFFPDFFPELPLSHLAISYST